MRLMTVAAAAVVVLAVAVVASVELLPVNKEPRPSALVPIGGPFTLTDQTGKRRSEAEFKGRLRLVFFGYSNCPDICPASLQTISWALEKLGDDAKKVAAIFITVDPGRDTPQRLAAYHKSFDARIVMLTGSEAEIDKVKKAFRVVGVVDKSKPGPDGKPMTNYPVNHSTLIYLFGRDGAYLAHFPHNAKPEDIVAEVRKHL